MKIKFNEEIVVLKYQDMPGNPEDMTILKGADDMYRVCCERCGRNMFLAQIQHCLEKGRMIQGKTMARRSVLCITCQKQVKNAGDLVQPNAGTHHKCIAEGCSKSITDLAAGLSIDVSGSIYCLKHLRLLYQIKPEVVVRPPKEIKIQSIVVPQLTVTAKTEDEKIVVQSVEMGNRELKEIQDEQVIIELVGMGSEEEPNF